MNAKTARQQRMLTITEGLEKLAKYFTDRHVSIANIYLTRNETTYDHVVVDSQPEDIVCKVEACSEGVTIAVSCLSRISAELDANVQSRTTWAAIAAAEWAEPVPTSARQVVVPMIGLSAEMQELNDEITRAARSNYPVLLLGESGTGKTTAAAMIHHQSRRATKPFIDVNCAAIPDALLESELFGYERGAFTGAVYPKLGLFETANKGTLFLDEIGELKLDLQAKILTAIEQQRTRRLGSIRYLKHDVRIIAASSRNLLQMMDEGRFREDLYYRLSVLEIALPPLRERRDDIPMLIKDRLDYELQRSGNKSELAIQDTAMAELNTYCWPGNIRQLHNVVARLCARSDGSRITSSAVRKELLRFGPPKHSYNGAISLAPDCRMLLSGESIHQFNRRIKRKLIEAVRSETGSMQGTSVRLKMERTALSKLYTRLKKDDQTALAQC